MAAVASATTKAICPDFPTLFRDASPGKLACALETAQAEQDQRIACLTSSSLCPLAQLLATVTNAELAAITNAAKKETIRRNHPQAAEIEAWMASDTVLKIDDVAALVLDYVTSNNDLWVVQDVANWYGDHSWLRAFEAAKNSPSILVKNHELALHTQRINRRVNETIRCDEVALEGVKFHEALIDGYMPVTLSEKNFYLASNRCPRSINDTTCITRLHEAREETQFWVLRGNTTYSITMNKPSATHPSNTPLVHKIDATKMTLLVNHDLIHSYRRVSDWPWPLQGSFHVIEDKPNSSDIRRIRNPVMNGVSNAVRKYWQDTNQPGAWN